MSTTSAEGDGLFDLTPSPRLKRGDRVEVATIWGQEQGTVVGDTFVDAVDQRAYVVVKIQSQQYAVDPARCVLLEAS